MVKMCGFVPQHDLALQYLTVKEHLYFMVSKTLSFEHFFVVVFFKCFFIVLPQARLKMDRRVSANQQTRIINSILQDLGLYYCTLTQLCNLSGGERKRVSLAVQVKYSKVK